jgi:4-amino-4-deoxy-L-arabinose transferase-like glycosyltransferase
MVVAAYAVTRAIEHGSTRWLAFAGAALGFGFLTKELQIFLVVPARALAYIVVAPGRLRRRLWQLAIAGATMIVTAGWWVALVELWPASARPYIGDSTNNSVLQLIFGLNGLDRISSAGGGPGGGFSGSAGVLRLFNSELGGQISWLLPATAIALVAGAIWTRHRPRTDCTRAALLLWGGWFGVTAVVYSFMTGIIHPYYTNVLAPAIAVLLGVGTVVLWRRRDQLHARALSAAMLATTGLWSFVLLDRDPSWHPWLRFAVLVGSLIAAGALLAGRRVAAEPRTALATVGLVAALAGPAAYTLSTVATTQAGQNPTAGPAAATTGPHPGAGAHQTTASRALVSLIDQNASRYKWVAASTDWQTAAAIQLAGGKPVMAIGGFTGFDNMTLTKFKHLVATHRIHYYVAGGGFGGPGGFSGPGRHGFSGAFAQPSGAGFVPPPGTRLGPPPGTRFGPPPGNGFGPPPGAGFGPAIGSFGPGGPGGGRGGPGGPGGPGGGRGAQASIQSWVSAHFRSQTLGGVTVYDLSQPKS